MTSCTRHVHDDLVKARDGRLREWERRHVGRRSKLGLHPADRLAACHLTFPDGAPSVKVSPQLFREFGRCRVRHLRPLCPADSAVNERGPRCDLRERLRPKCVARLGGRVEEAFADAAPVRQVCVQLERGAFHTRLLEHIQCDEGVPEHALPVRLVDDARRSRQRLLRGEDTPDELHALRDSPAVTATVTVDKPTGRYARNQRVALECGRLEGRSVHLDVRTVAVDVAPALLEVRTVGVYLADVRTVAVDVITSPAR